MPVRLGPRDPVEVTLKLTRRDPSTALGMTVSCCRDFVPSPIAGRRPKYRYFRRLVAPDGFDSGKTQGESAGSGASSVESN